MMKMHAVLLFGCIFLIVVTSAKKDSGMFLTELLNLRVQVNSLQKSISTQEEIISSLQQTVTKGGGDKGTVYTRWGRNGCHVGNGTHQVYAGFVGGGHYSHTGGAGNLLCMPEDPSPGQTRYSTYPGYIYGAEIEYGNDLFGLTQTNEDVACAVCRSSVHSISVMIPGRTACYSGWREVYSGFIVSGYYGYRAKVNYICMDSHPQPVPGGRANANGVLLSPVVTKCGSLPCPPYENDKLVPCVVCMM